MEHCKTHHSCEAKDPPHKHKEHGCCFNITDHIKTVANKAWSELLKEKIKKRYEEKLGTKMDEIAGVAADAAIEFWRHKIESKESCKEYEAKLHSVLAK